MSEYYDDIPLSDYSTARATEAQFVQAVRDTVAERPDFIYPDKWRDGGTLCLYIQPDAAGCACMFGCALHRIGWTIRELRECEGTGIASLLPYSLTVRMAAEAAQEVQDRHGDDGDHTWGAALAAFNARLAEGGWQA